jgi:hypothetical protein
MYLADNTAWFKEWRLIHVQVQISNDKRNYLMPFLNAVTVFGVTPTDEVQPTMSSLQQTKSSAVSTS